jgi:hypothetical protein
MSVPRLSFSQPVAKESVHKLAVCEVFPTEIKKLSGDHFLAAVAWPRRHAFFKPLSEGTDTHLIAETARQLALLVSHEGYEVPLTTPFVLVGLKGSFAPDYPANIFDANDVDQATVDIRMIGSPGVRRRYQVMMFFYQQESIFARVSVDCILLSGSKKRMTSWEINVAERPGCLIREGLLPPQRVGLINSSDVVLCQCRTSMDFCLSLDLENPFFFDHPVDHVSGMVMIEACRQLCRAILEPCVEIADIDIRFNRIAGLDRQTVIRQEDGTNHEERAISFTQGNNVCATARVRTHTLEHELIGPSRN